MGNSSEIVRRALECLFCNDALPPPHTDTVPIWSSSSRWQECAVSVSPQCFHCSPIWPFCSRHIYLQCTDFSVSFKVFSFTCYLRFGNSFEVRRQTFYESVSIIVTTVESSSWSEHFFLQCFCFYFSLCLCTTHFSQQLGCAYLAFEVRFGS